MKIFGQYLFLALIYILYLVEISLCNDNIYEQTSLYMQDSQIIDPHSLYYNRQSQKIQIPKNYKDKDVVNYEIIVRNVDNLLHCKNNHYAVFIERLINMLILKSNFQIINGMAFGKLDLEATIEELEILKSFREGNISIRHIDTIISNIVRPVPISLLNEVVSYIDILSMYIYEKRIIFTTIILTILVIGISLKTTLKKFKLIILTFNIMVLITYILTYWDLQQDKLIKLAAQQKVYSIKSKICHQNEINFSSKVLFLFSHYIGFGDDCEEYFKTIMTNPALKVTPMHVLTHMCTTFVFYPFSIAAYYLSDFIENYTGTLPWPLNVIIKIPLYFCIPISIGILILLLSGGSMGFQLGPFVNFYLSGKQFLLPSPPFTNNDRQAIEIIQLDIHKDILSEEKNELKIVVKNLNSSTNIKTQEYGKAVNNINKEFSTEHDKIFKNKIENEINQINIIKTTNSSKIMEKSK